MLTRFLKDINFRNRQRAINKKFEKDGLTDEVLLLQVALNKERHEQDISDPGNRVFDGFVQ